MLYRLVYVSNLNLNYPYDLGIILQNAIEFNKCHNITGALWFDGQQFAQLLEGQQADVEKTYKDKILPAKSHTDLTIKSHGACKSRIFSDWSMAYLSENSRQLDVAKKFMTNKGFNPRNCTSDDLVNLFCFLEDSRQRNAAKAIF